jgi:hypothetical protein
VNDQKTTKTGKSAGGAEIKTASPTGHEELEERVAAEQDGAKSPPERKGDRKRNPGVHEIPPQKQNPKHPGRAPRD